MRPSFPSKIQKQLMQRFGRAAGYSNSLMMTVIEALTISSVLNYRSVGPTGLITKIVS